MANRQPVRPRPGARENKHVAILRAARATFGRDGYTRASIDAIAADAGVSTRTIYNHFEGKEQLFAVVLESSAAEVADTFCEAVERTLKGTDLVEDLVALGIALLSSRSNVPEHFAMVRQINADAHHFPRAIIDAWQAAGPNRIEHEVALRLKAMADRGWLHVEHPRQAAAHFMAITAADVTATRRQHMPSLSRAEVHEQVRAGVDAFVNGYGARR